jgi:predicted restriction endonuclease
MLNRFKQWMVDNSSLSQNSIYKYARGLNTVSNDMTREGVIAKPLIEMSPSELDLAITLILNSPSFVEKNCRGNHMYSNALKQYRCFIGNTGKREEAVLEDIKQIEADQTLKKTERDILSRARIGQGIFRDQLMRKYSGKCVITGLAIPEVLIASHIKPWAVSDNCDRISVDNGLLLSATFDRLFDNGLISFMQDGEIMISGFVKQDSRSLLGIQPQARYNIMARAEMLENLEYHRDVVFVR